MKRIYCQFLAIFAALTFSLTTYASCDNDLTQNFVPLTLKSLEELSTQSVNEALKQTPAPGFFHLAELAGLEQKGTTGPQGLGGLLPEGLSFVETPAPTSPTPMAVSLTDPKQSMVLHMDLPWQGHTTATTVYASLPEPLPLNNDGYLIGPENPVVLFHMHGGGTPSATGKNAMSIGVDLAKYGHPVIGVDLPGHGRATRSLEGLTTMEGQVDWILAVLKKLVHPNVKVIMSGHSWGGEFALYMWLHSKEPKYRDANIERFIALSAPIDVSLNGDRKAKQDFEKWLDEHFDEYEARTAPTDFEFKKNILLNGKISDVGSYFTAFTEFDFITPLLTPEQQSVLMPLTMWTGQHDGLVYVGREEAYGKFGNSLTGANDFYLIPPGRTWDARGENDLKETGHGAFERYIDGTTRHETYQMLVDRMNAVAGERQPAKAKPDQAWATLSEFVRTYSNFIAFRELAARNVQYLRRSTGDISKLSARKNEVYQYVRTADVKIAGLEKDKENAIKIEGDAIRTRLGLEKSITVSRAEEELTAQPLSEAQRAEYKAYVDKIVEVDRTMSSIFDSGPFERQLAAIAEEFKPVMQQTGIVKLEDYRPVYEKYAALRNLSKEDAAIRSRLAALHQKFLDANKQNQTRFGTERDLLIALIPKPDGVYDGGDAIRQLGRDLSPERKAKLNAFIEQYPQAVATGEAKAQAALEVALAAIEKPEGIESLADARAQLEKLNAYLELTLIPEGNATAAALVGKIQTLDANRLAITKGSGDIPGLEKLNKALKELKDRRKALIAKWEALWRAEKLKSASVAATEARLVDLMLVYADAYKASEDLKGSGLLKLKESGQLNAENVMQLAVDVDPALTKMLEARDAYLKAAQELEKLKWSEAAAGRLEGETEEARTLANDVAALTAQIKEQEDFYESRRRAESIIIQERDQAQWEYLNLMRELGIELPFRLERIRILDLLNLPPDLLLAELRSNSGALEALQKCLNMWQEYAARIKEDDQRKGDLVE